MSRFFCLWIPHFPALAAMRAEPHLQGQLLLVHSRGRIIAASPQAREKGAQLGWTVARTQALIPNCLPVPHRTATTLSAWEEVLAALYTLTPCIEPMRPGLALADLRPPEIVKPLLAEWNAHGGVADDRIAAELAALTGEPGRIRNVRSGCTSTFLRRVPITVLGEAGVHVDTVERMGWFGWQSVAHLRPLSRCQLVAQFDQGELLYRYAQANDTRAVATYRIPPIVEMHFAFEEAAHEPGELEPVLKLLMGQACEQLNGCVAQSVTVGIHTSDGPLRRHRLLRDATASTYTLLRAAKETLYGLLRPALTVQRLDVTLGHLAQPQAVQGQLFGSSRPAVRTALQAVEHRFPGAIQRYRIVDPQAYLPEEFARLEAIDLQPEKCAKGHPMRAKHSAARGHSRVRGRSRSAAVAVQ